MATKRNKKLEKYKSAPKVAEKFSETEFFFDDCPICQAMKAAEDRGKDLSLEELHKVFRKTNRRQKK